VGMGRDAEQRQCACQYDCSFSTCLVFLSSGNKLNKCNQNLHLSGVDLYVDTTEHFTSFLYFCCAAIHCTRDVFVRSDQHSDECIQQLSSLRIHTVFTDVYLRVYWCQIRQQILADCTILCHLFHRLCLHWHFCCQSWSWPTVRMSFCGFYILPLLRKQFLFAIPNFLV